MKKKDYVIIIPARLGSTRLPEKPLISLKGIPIIKRTYQRCIKALPKNDVYVATDSKKIQNFCLKNFMNCIMTSKKCLTGTDRVAEAAKKINSKFYINIQGDEPFFSSKDIKRLIKFSKKYPKFVLNGFTSIKNKRQYFSSHVPKVVFNKKNELLYMSRSPIPGNKTKNFIKAWRQVCAYIFPKKMLIKFYNSNKKGTLEAIEDIEILRFTEMGQKVKMVKLSSSSMAIDTHQDLSLARKRLSK